MGQYLRHCHVFLGRIDDLGGGIVGPVPHPRLGWDRLGRIGHRGVVHGANPDCHPVARCHIPVAVFRTGDGGAFGGRGHVAMVCGHAGAGLVDIEPWLFTGRGGVAHGHGPAVGGLCVANAMVLCCDCGDRGGAVSVLAVAPRTHAAIDGRRKQQPWHGRTTLDAGRVPAPSSVLAYGAGADRAGRVLYRVFLSTGSVCGRKGMVAFGLGPAVPDLQRLGRGGEFGIGLGVGSVGRGAVDPVFPNPAVRGVFGRGRGTGCDRDGGCVDRAGHGGRGQWHAAQCVLGRILRNTASGRNQGDGQRGHGLGIGGWAMGDGGRVGTWRQLGHAVPMGCRVFRGGVDLYGHRRAAVSKRFVNQTIVVGRAK